MLIDHRLQLQLELGRRLRRNRRAILGGPLGANSGTSGRHILPHEKAKFVGPIIPPGRLDLDVLARHVEAELLRHLDIELEGLIRRRGIDAIRPVALIQRPVHVDIAIVEQRPKDPLFILAHRDLAHAEIAFYRVASQGYIKIIKEGRFRRPEPGLRDLQNDRGANFAFGACDDLLAITHNPLRDPFTRMHRHRYSALIKIRNNLEA